MFFISNVGFLLGKKWNSKLQFTGFFIQRQISRKIEPLEIKHHRIMCEKFSQTVIEN
jgi:hypothetical protein